MEASFSDLNTVYILDNIKHRTSDQDVIISIVPSKNKQYTFNFQKQPLAGVLQNGCS